MEFVTIVVLAVSVLLFLSALYLWLKSKKQLSSAYSENQTLNHLVNHDYLTDLYNRFYLINELEKLITQIKRGGPVSTLLFIDLDGFKDINDNLGHLAGDFVLKKIAAMFKRRCRKADIIARYGGDEFIIVLYNTDLKGAEEFAEGICDEMEKTLHRYHEHEVMLNCCIGIAAITSATTSVDNLINSADQAVYAAKGTGYNQIVLAN